MALLLVLVVHLVLIVGILSRVPGAVGGTVLSLVRAILAHVRAVLIGTIPAAVRIVVLIAVLVLIIGHFTVPPVSLFVTQVV